LFISVLVVSFQKNIRTSLHVISISISGLNEELGWLGIISFLLIRRWYGIIEKTKNAITDLNASSVDKRSMSIGSWDDIDNVWALSNVVIIEWKLDFELLGIFDGIAVTLSLYKPWF